MTERADEMSDENYTTVIVILFNVKGYHHTKLFVKLKKFILNFATAFGKKYIKNFNATCIVDIVKDMMGFGFLTVMSAQSS